MRCQAWFSFSQIFAMVMLLSVSAHVWSFSNIEVTSTSGAANVSDACSLRDAITAANTDTPVGGCPAGSGADSIQLPEGAVITLSETDNDTRGNNGLPSISSAILLDGSGATIRRDPDLACDPILGWFDEGNEAEDGEFRLLHVDNGGDLVVINVTLEHGCPDSSESPGRSGGAIAVFNGGRLTVEQSTFRHNLSGSSGGAILVNTSEETIIRFSQFLGNESFSNAGAIASDGGLTSIEHSLIEGNVAGSSGGGLFVSFGQLNVIGSTVANNRSRRNGGGIATANSTSADNLVFLRLIQSTISGNTAGSSGDSMSPPSNGYGGAISSLASLNIQYSSLINNRATEFDALFFDSGIRGEDTRSITGSILSGAETLCGGSTLDRLTAAGENLSTGDSCPGFTLVNTDPLLGPLADNGGPTPTHALLPDSPAIDASGECPGDQATDQRELPRPGAGSTLCDLGSFEYQSPFIFSDRFER